MLRTNFEGQQLIRGFEDLRLSAYQDGGGVWTIGYGHTGPEVIKGLWITVRHAEELLVIDLAEAEAAVDMLVSVPLNENEFSALASLVYNIGAGRFRSSTMLRLLNMEHRVRAAAEFKRWIYDNGRIVKGLVRRRAAERALFEKPPAPEQSQTPA